jgi:hypothetical protein
MIGWVCSWLPGKDKLSVCNHDERGNSGVRFELAEWEVRAMIEMLTAALESEGKPVVPS